jgi:hypothetical protein
VTREQISYVPTRDLLAIVRSSTPQLEDYTAAKAELLARRDAVQPVVVEDDCAPAIMRYQATDGDYDLDTAVGRGATPEEAVEDLYWTLDLEAEELNALPDLIACERCNGSGEVAHFCSYPCGYAGPGPVPDYATGVRGHRWFECQGTGIVEDGAP